MDIDTSNKYFVACVGDKLKLLRPPHDLLSKHDAMVLAAYLVCMAEVIDSGPSFKEALSAVQNA